MKRIEVLNNLNKSKKLKIYHLSKVCFLLTDRKLELKASTFDEWKKYLFSFEEAKQFLISQKGV